MVADGEHSSCKCYYFATTTAQGGDNIPALEGLHQQSVLQKQVSERRGITMGHPARLRARQPLIPCLHTLSGCGLIAGLSMQKMRAANVSCPTHEPAALVTMPKHTASGCKRCLQAPRIQKLPGRHDKLQQLKGCATAHGPAIPDCMRLPPDPAAEQERLLKAELMGERALFRMR